LARCTKGSASCGEREVEREGGVGEGICGEEYIPAPEKHAAGQEAVHLDTGYRAGIQGEYTAGSWRIQ
jgi:hypothetical protein